MESADVNEPAAISRGRSKPEGPSGSYEMSIEGYEFKPVCPKNWSDHVVAHWPWTPDIGMSENATLSEITPNKARNEALCHMVCPPGMFEYNNGRLFQHHAAQAAGD